VDGKIWVDERKAQSNRGRGNWPGSRGDTLPCGHRPNHLEAELANCAADVAVTGEPGFAKTYALSAEARAGLVTVALGASSRRRRNLWRLLPRLSSSAATLRMATARYNSWAANGPRGLTNSAERAEDEQAFSRRASHHRALRAFGRRLENQAV